MGKLKTFFKKTSNIVLMFTVIYTALFGFMVFAWVELINLKEYILLYKCIFLYVVVYVYGWKCLIDLIKNDHEVYDLNQTYKNLEKELKELKKDE